MVSIKNNFVSYKGSSALAAGCFLFQLSYKLAGLSWSSILKSGSSNWNKDVNEIKWKYNCETCSWE